MHITHGVTRSYIHVSGSREPLQVISWCVDNEIEYEIFAGGSDLRFIRMQREDALICYLSLKKD